MKVCGIIAEYNPFHNGHLYQIRQIREQLEPVYIVAVMSGDFVQRGEPAIQEARKRAKAALSCGVDLVILLPVSASTASAEAFALSGVSILNALGVVDQLSFGCETEDIHALKTCSLYLSEEPELYRQHLKAALREGISFPAARVRALKELSPELPAETVLGSPNNILACEYLKALHRTGSRIRPLPVVRTGDGYHSKGFSGDSCPSASAIRSFLLSGTDTDEVRRTLPSYVPSASADLLFKQLEEGAFLTKRDLDPLLAYQLLRAPAGSVSGCLGVTEPLGNRILNQRNSFRGFESFCDLLKTKEITYSHISRALLNIVLNIRETKEPSFIRILGFRKDAAPLLREIRSHASLPLVTRPAKDIKSLSAESAEDLRHDLFASGLYESLLSLKENRPMISEYEKQLVIC